MTDSLIRIATHDGPYHGDDVLAVAILSRIFKDHQVIRSRDKDILDLCDFVVDVGGQYDHTTRRYDHHMPDPPTEKNNHVLSSAGLIWRHYAHTYFRAINLPRKYTYKDRTIDLFYQVEKIIHTRWIYPIDRSDNGVSLGPTPISEIVSAMSPIEVEKSRESFNHAFLKTVGMVSTLFERACFHAADFVINKLHFSLSTKEVYEDGKVIYIDNDVKQFGNFGLLAHHFVVYPVKDFTSGEVHYNVRPVYDTNGYDYRTPFPNSTLGLDRDELESLGIEGVSFIHHTGFMAKADSKEAALNLCRISLNDRNHR